MEKCKQVDTARTQNFSGEIVRGVRQNFAYISQECWSDLKVRRYNFKTITEMNSMTRSYVLLSVVTEHRGTGGGSLMLMTFLSCWLGRKKRAFKKKKK